MRFLSTIILMMTTVALWAQHQPGRLDSIQHVEEVVVISRYNHKEVIPSQTLNGEQLERLNTHSVADALRYFSGI